MAKNLGGRPRQGITRKVSLTLTEGEWAEIEASGLSVAAYIKLQMAAGKSAEPLPRPYPAETVRHVYPDHNPPADNAPLVSVALDRRNIPFVIRAAVTEARRSGALVPDEDVVEAERRMIDMIFPRGVEHAQLAVLHQYVCPATGKRFGSAYKLLMALAPKALDWPAAERERKRLAAEIKARQQAPRYFDQIR